MQPALQLLHSDSQSWTNASVWFGRLYRCLQGPLWMQAEDEVATQIQNASFVLHSFKNFRRSPHREYITTQQHIVNKAELFGTTWQLLLCRRKCSENIPSHSPCSKLLSFSQTQGQLNNVCCFQRGKWNMLLYITLFLTVTCSLCCIKYNRGISKSWRYDLWHGTV